MTRSPVGVTLLVASLLFALGIAAPAFAQRNRVQICHAPPGNPDNVQLITVSANAQAAHLRHGDFLPTGLFPDGDGDGFGDASASSQQICAAVDVPGFVADNSDCNDGDAAVNPGAAEQCNGVDDDCNAVIDDTPDADGDGFTICTDCNDNDGAIHPGAAEQCNGVDDNCNAIVDDTPDADGDGFTICTDCNDGDAAVNPGAAEQCNGVDDNCNAIIDDTPDADGDGFTICDDCNDNDAAINPDASEVCGNGIDDDCNGVSDEALDEDGDGWTTCGGDCCDGGQCGAPSLVNPGAFEIVGNNVDDDCDAATLDTGPAACSFSADFSNLSPEQLAGAMEICRLTAPEDDTWGLLSAELRFADGSFPSGAQLNTIRNQQAAVLTDYGTGGIVPQAGNTMVGLSTGRMRDQNDPGFVNPSPGTDFGHQGNPPALYLAANGGALPSSAGCNGNCPNGSGANDSVNLRLTLRVPTNALGFEYDARWFSAEYLAYTCTVYNDFHLALLQSGAAGVPADTNIAFDALGNPVSSNNAFFQVCVPQGCHVCPNGTTALQGTGLQVNNTGGGTEWLINTAPVVPGEIITLELIVFDVSDGIGDTISLLDNFRWIPNPAAFIQ